jgi:dihydrolipoamide dehydrogenase
MSEYDVVVIGAGVAGYVCAIRSSQLGLKTAVVEKKWLGGVCLNVGCIPSKALLKNAEVADILRNRGKEFGFKFENLELDFSAAVKRSRKVSDRLTKGVGFLMKKNNIEVIMGSAKINSRDLITVINNEGETSQITTKNIVIATGASVSLLPDWEVDGEKIVTYLEAITQEKLPESVIIIGGGAIGVEFATIWNAYGVEVTIVEMLPTLLPLEDEEIGKELAKELKKRKIEVLTGHRVENINRKNDIVEVLVSNKDGQQDLKADQALVAIGFTPNSKELGLEEIGIEINKRGAIVIDEKMETNVPGIWAIGDVTAKLMLAHVGSAQGIVCAENIAGSETVKLDYEMMPRATYCSPQVASFGLSETQAVERGFTVISGRFPFQANGKALGIGEGKGWVKIICDEKYGEILGAHMIGPEVTELLPELTISQMMELTANEIARNVHAHPSLSEAIMEAAHSVEGNPINI